MKKRYIHQESVHNLDSAEQIVPLLIKLFAPKSVVDFGCGLGTFLNCFKSAGVNTVLGIDGPWVNKNLLYKFLKPDEFKEWDLENKVELNQNFDLVISLEVAEHLSEDSADTFIETLIDAGTLIVFGAAIPFQEGQNHLNEQWIDYWEKKFNKHNYVMHDILRPIFWDNKKIFWWYKQNMALFSHKDFKLTDQQNNLIKNIVHPECYINKCLTLEAIKNGEAGIKTTFIYFFRSIAFRMQNILK